MHEMSHPYLVSEEAQTYPTIQVDIQDPQPAALPLLETAAQAALSAHAQSTPVYTIADSLQKSIKKSKIRILTQTSQIFMYVYNHLQPLQFDFGQGPLGNVS